MKKIVSIILSVVISISLFPIISYANDNESVIKQYNEMIKNYDNEKSFVEEIDVDSEILLVNQTAMVSLDTLCESIGASYTNETVSKTGYSTITYDDRKIWYDEKSGLIDIQTPDEDNIIVLDEVPYQENETTMVPLEQFADAMGYGVFEENDDYILTRPYQTCRLLVSTKNDLKIDNAVNKVYDSKNDIEIIQFENETDTINAKEKLEKQNYTVDTDEIISTSDKEKYDIDALDLDVVDEHNSPNSSEAVHIDDMNEYLGTKRLNDVLVAVVDTGVCSTHPALKDRIICSDVNFSSSEQNNSEDDQGHGTHVTGIILDNSLSNVKVMAVKALSGEGSGTDYQIYCAMKYAAENGAKVINMSLGKRGTPTTITEELVDELWNKGVSVVVSAGNSGAPTKYYSPAQIEKCVTVSATNNTKNYQVLGFPNFGKPVDCFVPGYNINSTYLKNSYAVLSGTSMAAPLCSAIVGMMYSYNNNYSAEYVHNKIRESCVPFEDGRFSYDEGWKTGFLDCRGLFEYNCTPMPTASVESCNYENEFEVTLSCEDKNAKIYYTTDGTRPSNLNSELYTAPIKITKTTMLRAIAYSDEKLPSFVCRYDYKNYFRSSEGMFTIDGDGIIIGFKNPNNENITELHIPEKIDGITVTALGPLLFFQNMNIRYVYLPKTCTTIYGSFIMCQNLRKVYGDNITTLSSNAFYYCNNLISVDSENIEFLGNNAFQECTSLASFSNNKLEEIYAEAFYNCKSLSYVNLPNVKNVYDGAFKNCYSLEQINMNKIETIGKEGFRRTLLSEINMPKLQEVGVDAFNGCYNLEKADLEALENLPDSFYNCTALNSLNIPKVKNADIIICNSLTELNAPLLESINVLTSNKMKYLNLPNLKEVGRYINCSKLIYAYLPSLEKCTNTSTSNELFSNCFELEEIYLPKLTSSVCPIYDVTSSTFWNKTKIKRINIPKFTSKSTKLVGKDLLFKIKNITSDNDMLIADVTGINIDYTWYYSATGNDSSYIQTNVKTSQFVPSKNGYYILKAYQNIDNDYIDKSILTSEPIYYEKSTNGEYSNIGIKSDCNFYVEYNDTKIDATYDGFEYIFTSNIKNGTKVTLKSLNSSFDNWINDNNRVISENESYVFCVSSDTSIVGKSKKQGVVSFYSSGNMICSNSYETFKADDYPEVPAMYRHKFEKWDKTVEEINDAITKGQSISVNAIYSKIINYLYAGVYGGKIKGCNNKYELFNELSLVSVIADKNELPFLYWIDNTGNIVSYEENYQFYITRDLELTAVYGYEKITPSVISRMVGNNLSDDKITFVSEYWVPEDCEVLEHGIILTTDNSLNSDTFVLGGENVLKGTSTQNTNSGTYILTKKNVQITDNWRGRCYVIYKSKLGKIYTKYSNI